MDMESNSLNEPKKLEQIVSQFLLKCLHVILDSRIPSLHSHDNSGDLSSQPRVRKSDKWFNLALGDRPAALNNLNFWHRNVMDPMIIDIILVHNQPDSSTAALPGSSSSIETVIERWVVQYKSPHTFSPQSGESFLSYKKTYQKSIILLRSLFTRMRLLPAYRIFRQLSTSSQTYDFDIIYKVSSFSDPFSIVEEEMVKDHSFSSIEAPPGRLSVSLAYRPTLADFNLECSTSLPPMIIMDYVGSPTTDPLRSFPSTEKGVCATSFPLRGQQSPTSGPFQRPHSWTSGFQRAATFAENRVYYGSPPASRKSSMPYDFPSPSSDLYGNRGQNVRPLAYLHSQTNINDEYQLSPPFSSSPSPSPSPPTYFASGMKSRMHSQTSPVSIPIQMGKSSRYVSPNFSDPNRHSLPPLSPRSIKNDNSSHESPSGIRSYRKEILRSGEFQSGMANHYSSPKVARDSKDESGRFSGLLSSSGSPRIGFSRSSSRLSFQDDTDDGDFSCPFDFDDVETPDFLLRKRTSEFTSQSLPLGTKSQDAAVGVLVHMLRTAPPLRQDSSCFTSQCLKTDTDEEVATASGFFMPRKAADALEELRSYREMKDLLLSKSGTRVLNREED